MAGKKNMAESSPATPQSGISPPNEGTGFMDTARRLLWRTNNKAPPVNNQQEEESADQNMDAEDEDSRQNGVDDTAGDEEEIIQVVRSPARPLAIEIQLPAGNGRRRRAEEQSPDDQPPAKKPVGRPKGSRKAQGSSKKNNETPPSTSRQSSGKFSGKLRGHILPAQVEELSLPKDKRGRPRKIPKGKANEIQENDREPAMSLPEHELTQLEYHDGDTGLYDSQSPVKGQHLPSKAERLAHLKPKTGPPSASSRDEKTAVIHSSRPSSSGNQAVQISKAAVEEMESSGDEDSEDERTESAPPLDSEPLIDFDHFEKMLIIARRVGHFHLKAGDKGRLILREVDKDYQTNSGKRVVKSLRKLSQAYETLRDVRTRDEDSEAAVSSIADHFEGVLNRVEDLMGTRFKIGTPPEYDKPIRTKNVLRDIYFLIVPQYVELLLLAATVNPLQESMDTVDLEQFRLLVRTFSALIHSASEIPMSHQPQIKDLEGEYGTKTFEILKPTKQLKPMVRFVEKKLKDDIIRRDREAEGGRLEEMRLLEAQRREERGRQEAIERRRKVEEADRRMKEAVNNHHLYDHPLFGPELRRKDQEDRERARLCQSNQTSHQSVSSNGSNHRRNISHDEDDRDRNDQDVDQYENQDQDQDVSDSLSFLDQDPLETLSSPTTLSRVRGVFGSNNSNHVSTPWSKVQYSRFIEIMREDASDDRYSRAAKEVHLSMDEIFALAREVQAAFDSCHDKGDLMDKGDAWTYDVWIEPEVVG